METPAPGPGLNTAALDRRERTALAASRAGAAAVLIGAFTSPPLANVGAAAMLIGFGLSLYRLHREPEGEATTPAALPA